MTSRIPTLLSGLFLFTLAACNTLARSEGESAATARNTVAASTATAIVWFPPTATKPVELQPTQQPTPEKKPGIGALLLEDDLSSQEDWITDITDRGGVGTSEKGITIGAQPGIGPVTILRKGNDFGNLYLEVTALPSLCREADSFGLLFRAPNNAAYYRFAVACNGTTNAERINIGGRRELHPPIASADAPVGALGVVQLGLWAVDSEFRFFLNGRYQFSASDSSYPMGAIGVFAQAAGETPVTVTFSDLHVYSVTDPQVSQTPKP